MRKPSKKKRIEMAANRVREEMTGQIDPGNRFSRGLSPEGFLGGYLKALQDVTTFLNSGSVSAENRRFWRD
jgi:hypothetical protein